MERQRPGQVFILGQGLGVGRGCLRSPRGGHCGTKAQAQLSVGCGSEGRVSLLCLQPRGRERRRAGQEAGDPLAPRGSQPVRVQPGGWLSLLPRRG